MDSHTGTDDGKFTHMAVDGHDDDNDVKVLRREMLVAIEGVHDHLRMVAEASAGRDEAIIRRIDEINAVNREEHETFRKVLANHNVRITTLEQER
jgi:hypothetical protein